MISEPQPAPAPTPEPVAPPAIWPGLTPMQTEVARRLALGATSREVAVELGIAVKTVDTHRSHVLKRLGLRNNVDLARHALRCGYVALDGGGQ